MRLTALLVGVALLQSTVMAHMALLYPTPRGDERDKAQWDGEIHTFIGYNSKRTFPCNGYNKPGPVTHLEAGQVVPMRFWGPALKENYINKLPSKPSKGGKQLNQARHGGGLCQVSLSYDGGKTYHLIGEYSESCPDFYYEWPIMIPKNAPSCNTPGKCLFVWSWTAYNVPQYYVNCADVTIKGKSGGKLNPTSIQVVDFKGRKQHVTDKGDAAGDKMGNGPIKSQIAQNLKGVYSV
ncbi:hypothetical protein BGZ49_009860 [Haplosporangium sp. Z 27]|nr:hypothetical protein BGZ49_009860 [Haplosporangium sp. Z 27]